MAKPVPWLIPAVWTGALLPVPMLAVQAQSGDLGANPVAEVLNRLGLLTLVSLLACLSCTPVQTSLGWTWAIRIRKHLGNIAFTYACLHFTTWAAIDHGLDWQVLLDDVVKRPFITVGFLAWLTLIPLAVTSTANAVKRLGFTRWKRLHRLVYVVGALASMHFIWRGKTLQTEAVIYGAVYVLLMSLRVLTWARLRQKRQRAKGFA